MAYKYFMYSSTQLAWMKAMGAKRGLSYKPGTVFTKGKKYTFTELSSTGVSNRYSDSKVVAEGEATSMSYTEPTGV